MAVMIALFDSLNALFVYFVPWFLLPQSILFTPILKIYFQSWTFLSWRLFLSTVLLSSLSRSRPTSCPHLRHLIPIHSAVHRKQNFLFSDLDLHLTEFPNFRISLTVFVDFLPSYQPVRTVPWWTVSTTRDLRLICLQSHKLRRFTYLLRHDLLMSKPCTVLNLFILTLSLYHTSRKVLVTLVKHSVIYQWILITNKV